MTRRRRVAGAQRAVHHGQALVEFTLTVFIFLGTVLSVFEAGRLTVTYADLVYAVREGGRAAALPPPVTTTANDVCVAVAEAAKLIDIPCADVAVDTGGAFADRTTGDTASVTGRHVFVPLIAALFGQETSITLSQTAVFTVE